VEELFDSVIECLWTIIFRQTELHTTEPLVPGPSAFDIEMPIEKLKRYKSRGIDQFPTGLIPSGSRTVHSEIHEHVDYICNKEKLLQ
jgi:hypothetical protein